MADRDLWRKNVPEDFEGRMGENWDDEIQMKPIIWSSVAIVISFVIAVGFCWWLMEGVFEPLREKATPSPIAEANERRLPPTPWLQPKPEMEMDEWLEIQEARTEGYGWVDELDGLVHIPVEAAMEMVLSQRGEMPASVEPGPETPVDVEAEAGGADAAPSEEPIAESEGSADAADANAGGGY